MSPNGGRWPVANSVESHSHSRSNQNIDSRMQARLGCHVQYTVDKWRVGCVHVALTRGQTGLAVTQVALLLRDADVWGWVREKEWRQ